MKCCCWCFTRIVIWHTMQCRYAWMTCQQFGFVWHILAVSQLLLLMQMLFGCPRTECIRLIRLFCAERRFFLWLLARCVRKHRFVFKAFLQWHIIFAFNWIEWFTFIRYHNPAQFDINRILRGNRWTWTTLDAIRLVIVANFWATRTKSSITFQLWRRSRCI